MSFVIYEKDSTYLASFGTLNYYATEAAAKGAITRQINKGLLTEEEAEKYVIADVAEFKNSIEKTKVVRSVMNGEPVTIPVNTPRSCDPSSELYWCM